MSGSFPEILTKRISDVDVLEPQWAYFLLQVSQLGIERIESKVLSSEISATFPVLPSFSHYDLEALSESRIKSQSATLIREG